MVKIFLDESGDLGFNEGSSKWLILIILLTENHRRIEKEVKKVHKGLRRKYKNIRELHAYNSNSITKRRLLKNLAEQNDCQVLCIVLNKERVYIYLQNQKNYLYNWTTNILLDRLYTKNIIQIKEDIEIYIDQKETNKFLRDNFEKYLRENLLKWKNDRINIQIKPSHTEKCLQAVDFISWAIFRKYEMGDYSYYEIIKEKIIEENLLFP